MSELIGSLPPLLQIMLLIGIGIAGGIVYLYGRRSESGDKTEGEISALQELLLNEKFRRLESDLQLVVQQSREGIMKEVHQITGSLTAQIAELSSRIDRLAGRIRHRDSDD